MPIRRAFGDRVEFGVTVTLFPLINAVENNFARLAFRF